MKTKEVNRKFGLLTGTACLLILLWQYLVHQYVINWLAGLAVLLLLIAVIIPRTLNPLRLIWERIGEVLGIVNTFIILFLLYFLIVTPLGIVMRLMKKSSLDLKFRPGSSTYWGQVDESGQSSMKQQF